jgi:phosphoglucomutase/phosphomannomutase
MHVKQIRDYSQLTVTVAGGAPQPLDAPQGNMLILDLAEPGHFIAVRPSGTEPKIKFYLFGFVPAEQLHLLDTAQTETDERLRQMEADLRAYTNDAPL